MINIIKLDYCYFDIVTSFIYVLKVYDMSENLRLRLIMIVNETKINISKGLRSKLQLTGMICRLIKEIQRDE